MKPNELKLPLYFLILAFFWGSSFVVIKFALESFDSWFSAAARMAMAFLIISIFAVLKREKLKIDFELGAKIWITGLFTLGIPFALLFWGEQYVSAGLAGMANGTTPLWTALLAFFMVPTERRLLEKPSSLIGLVLGIGGIVLLFLPILQTKDFFQIEGALAVLGMAVCYAVGNVFNRVLFSKYDQISILTSSFHQHLASFLFLLLGWISFGKTPESLGLLDHLEAWCAIFYLAIFSTSLALGLFFKLVRTWGAVKTSAVTYVVPVFAVFLDFLIFKNQPEPLSLAGIAVIFVGIYFIRAAKA
jgi:drug/metabolite transporter (DMT)-like permease